MGFLLVLSLPPTKGVERVGFDNTMDVTNTLSLGKGEGEAMNCQHLCSDSGFSYLNQTGAVIGKKFCHVCETRMKNKEERLDSSVVT